MDYVVNLTSCLGNCAALKAMKLETVVVYYLLTTVIVILHCKHCRLNDQLPWLSSITPHIRFRYSLIA